MLAVVIERHMRARRDASRQILQALQQIGFGFDEGGFGDEAFGLGDGIGQRLRIHPGITFRSNIGPSW